MQDLSNFNEFFMDAEEDAIVRLPVLKQRLAAAASPQQVAAAKRELVLFHGACCAGLLCGLACRLHLNRLKWAGSDGWGGGVVWQASSCCCCTGAR